MKSIVTSFMSVVFIALLSNSAGAAAPRNAAELVGKRELWPAEVTVLQGAQFQNGRSIRKGQIVVLDEVTRQGVKLDDGAMFFMYPAEKTDLMQRVGEMFTTLSPEQLALTLDAVLRDESLWPTRATLRWGLTLDGGVNVPAGQELLVMGFRPDGQLRAASIEQNVTVPVDPWYTDVFSRARKRVGTQDDTPFSYRLLESMLDPSADGSTIGDYDYVVMYDGRDSCSRSVAFAPELAAFQQEKAAEGATWQLVLVNGASRPRENRAHYRKMELEGRIAKDGWGPALYNYFELGGYQTPWLYVFDANGKQVATAGEPMDSSRRVLSQLSQMLLSAAQ